MQQMLLVMVGGALGAGARFGLGQWVAARSTSAFPIATLAINILGCFAMGVLMGWLARSGAGETLRILLGVGLLGGFTTFSAFSLDWWQLLERGAAGAAMAYLALSVLGALAAFVLGVMIVRMLP
jgi:fluoride exporter